MRLVLLLLIATPLAACPSPEDWPRWRVRSVRPLTAATRPLLGQPLRAEEIEEARRSFDPSAAARLAVSVTITYLERCEQNEANLVFRTFRFRLPYHFGFVPAFDYARSWLRTGIDWHRDFGPVSFSYSANYTSLGFRQQGMITARSRWVEGRVAAGSRMKAARVTAIGPALWQRPLLPAVLRDEPELQTQLNAGFESAESMLRLEEYARDPAFQRIVSLLADLERDGAACLTSSFKRRLRSARRESGARQYGLVDALLANTSAPDCETASRARMREEFTRIDKAVAAQRAAAQIAELRTLADRLLYRTPLFAVRPVAIVEAIVSPTRRALPGAGGGIRVSLLNWLEVTGGYSSRTPFFEVRFRDPLR